MEPQIYPADKFEQRFWQTIFVLVIAGFVFAIYCTWDNNQPQPEPDEAPQFTLRCRKELADAKEVIAHLADEVERLNKEKTEVENKLQTVGLELYKFVKACDRFVLENPQIANEFPRHSFRIKHEGDVDYDDDE